MYVFEKLRQKGKGVIDAHAHIYFNDELNNNLLKLANIFNIGRMYVSIYPFDLDNPANPSYKSVFEGNMKVLDLCKKHSIFRGMVFVNHLDVNQVDMAEKFLREGFAGIGEIYRYGKFLGKLAEPFMSLAKEYDVPVLIHTAHRLYPRGRVGEMDSNDIVKLAKKWPNIRIIMSHISGGGDWEYAIRVIKNMSNVYIDIGGSVVDMGIIEKAVEVLKPHRILFASDNLIPQAIGRVEDAKIDEDIKELIYAENALKVFKD